jgi:hypothetical protein
MQHVAAIPVHSSRATSATSALRQADQEFAGAGNFLMALASRAVRSDHSYMRTNLVRLRALSWVAFGLASLTNTGRSDAIPYPEVGTPVVFGQTLIANGGEVTVHMPAISGAFFDNYLFLFSPTPRLAFDSGPPPVNFLFWNHGIPGTQSLGTFAPGTELIFGLYTSERSDSDNDPQTPDEIVPLATWYTGPGDRNEDGFVHAYMVNEYGGDPNSTYVAFEDLNGGTDGTGADWNYLDIEFVFTGASSIPEPTTLSLAGLGLISLRAFARRRSIAAQW